MVKLSSPYRFHVAGVAGAVRTAGKAGMGDGERPYRAKLAGELGAFEPLKEDRLDEGCLSMGGGGNMADELATDVAGVSGTFAGEGDGATIDGVVTEVSSRCCSLTLVMTDSASLALDSLRNIRGRLVLGVAL